MTAPSSRGRFAYWMDPTASESNPQTAVSLTPALPEEINGSPAPSMLATVLLFNSLIIHEAAPNTSQHLRLSIDCRFQSYRNPVDPAVLVFTGSGNRSWEATYANWPSDELQYYWRKLPLQLKPSMQELIQLAETAESPAMRARYARILDRITAQLPGLATQTASQSLTNVT